MKHEHLLSFALDHPWAVTRPMLTVIATILARSIAGIDATREEIQAALVNRKNLPQPKVGSVGVVPVYGVIAPRMNLLSQMSGGTSFEMLASQVRKLASDDSIKTIVLDIDSPGGSVAGSAELAHELMRTRTKKPIIAVAQYTMASAAYHLAAAATEIVAAPSARVGSIGTFAIHNDMSAALDKLGIKRTFIAAGEGKVDGNETEPLTTQAHARIAAAVNDSYDQFVKNVVRGRGGELTAEVVRDEWQAHVYSAHDAKRLGMVDTIATLDDTLARLLGSHDLLDARAAQDDHASVLDTAQEPARVTAQDRARGFDQQRTALALLDL